MIAEQATVFALAPSAGRHFQAAVAGLAFGTDDIGRPHVREFITRRRKFQLGPLDGGASFRPQPALDQAALLPFDAGIDCIRTFARLP